VGGRLYLLVYGRVSAVNVDPVEKKPLYHFLPGTNTFSIGTLGCNFKCENCQNYSISQANANRIYETRFNNDDFSGADLESDKNKSSQKVIDETKIDQEAEFNELGQKLLPKEIVKLAKENKCKTISYTYNEPTIFLEYALDTMKLAHKAGLKNIWVSNGFMTKQALKSIMPYLDAINIDIKSFEDDFYNQVCKARLNPVLENCKTLIKNKIWLEVTTLIIPGYSDDLANLEKLARFIYKELGKEVPWHLSAFSPVISWKMQGVKQTKLPILEKAYKMAKKIGLKNVYLGNV
jgi:pyruvate formate lyase activating enzyme